jgi:uncharacterized membrane protein
MPQHSSGSLSRHERIFVASLVALSLLLRLYRIGAQSLWIDEMLTIGVSCPREGLNIWSYLKFNIHGPLHSFVVYLFHLISQNDGWLRVPGALAGTATVYYLYRWVRLWIGVPAARIGAVLMAVHPLHIHYSQELRNYAFLLFFGVMACYFFERMQRDGGRRFWVRYILAIVCAALSNFTAAFLFATHTVLYFARFRINRATVTRWAIVSVVVLVLISPWVYRVYKIIDVSDLVTPVAPGQIDDSRRLRGETTFTLAAIPYMVYTFCAGFSLGPSTRDLHMDTSAAYLLENHAIPLIWVVVLFGGLFVWGLFRSVVGRSPWKEMLLYLCLPVLFTIVLNWQNAKAFNVRYVLTAFPSFLCFLAVGLAAFTVRARITVATAVLATLLWSDGNYFHNGRYAREDVRAAVGYVEGRIAPDECIFAPTVSNIVRRYYGGMETVHSVYNPPGYSRERLDTRLEVIFAECNSVWYLRSRPWVDDADGYVLETCRSRYRQSDVIYFDGVELFYFTPRKGGD